MTFRLGYEPSIPEPPQASIYVEIACTQQWVRVLDSVGDAIPIQSDCGLCRCDACDTCAVCDCALLFEEIAAGEYRDLAWDGETHPSEFVATCGVCEIDSALEPGTYTARFCYSLSQGGPFECSDVSFDYPLDTLVEHVVVDPDS